MAPSTKNTNGVKGPLSMANMIPCATVVGNEEYVREPPNYEEKLRIYKSQVLIPYTISETTHALMGLMHDPSEDLTNLREFFPSYHRIKPLVSIKGAMNLEYLTTTLRAFQSAPPTKKHDDYISWLDKIESKMSEI